MVQGSKKLTKNGKAKLNKHNVEKAAGHNTVRVGLKKAAKKPGRGKGNTSAVKVNKKLTGAITSHIEDIMMLRLNEDRGQSAASSLKVLEKKPDAPKVEKKKRKW